MKTRLFSALTISALLFASCSNDDNSTPEINDGRVKFSSGVSATSEATTRVSGANGDQWDGNEHIGIYMIGHIDMQIKESAENIEYATTSVGASTSFTSATPIYYPVNLPAMVDFIAYHPYDASVSNYVYPINLATQTNQSAIDLMSAKTTTGYDKNDHSAVNLQFRHQLVKVAINVTTGDGVTSLSGLSVKIKGMNTAADFDVFNATLSNINNIDDITPYKQPSAYTYEAILLPVALGASHIVEFSLGGNVYKWEMKDNTININSLNQNAKYTFNVALHKKTVSVTGEITPWINYNIGGVAQ